MAAARHPLGGSPVAVFAPRIKSGAASAQAGGWPARSPSRLHERAPRPPAYDSGPMSNDISSCSGCNSQEPDWRAAQTKLIFHNRLIGLSLRIKRGKRI